jgi:hypothetical protein
MRRKRGEVRFRLLRLELLFFCLADWFLVSWVFLEEDCAAEAGTQGKNSRHRTATVSEIRFRTDCQR